MVLYLPKVSAKMHVLYGVLIQLAHHNSVWQRLLEEAPLLEHETEPVSLSPLPPNGLE